MAPVYCGRHLFGSGATALIVRLTLTRNQRALAAVLSVSLTVPVCEAAGRHRLQSIDVSDLIAEQVHSEVSESVWGLAFSPDETQLVIGFGQHWTTDSRIARGHVVVVALNQPKKVLHHFDVTGAPTFPLPGNLRWSPSGQYLAVDTRVFTLDGELVCGLADAFRFAGFLDEDRTVIYNWHGPIKGFEVRRSDCMTEDAWETVNVGQVRAGQPEVSSPGVSGLATCPQAGLITIGGSSAERIHGASPLDPRPAAIDVITYPGHGSTRPWTGNGDALLGGMVFADSCRLICAGKPRSDSKGYFAACWDIEKREVTVEQPAVTLTDLPSFEAVADDWVASTVFKWSCLQGKLWDFFDLGGCVAKLRRRVIWNVRSGQELISWSPPEQKIELPGSPHKRASQPFAFAMSSHHRVMAEGGAGGVQIYSFPSSGA